MAARIDMCCAISIICLCRMNASKRYLSRIGISRVTVVGDTRFDRVLQNREEAKQLPLVENFKEQLVDFCCRKLMGAG